MADKFPDVLTNPERPNAPFTHQGNGNYLTVTGDYIFFDALLPYILSATGTPTADDIRKAQTLLNAQSDASYNGTLQVNGVLDSDTARRIVQFQMARGDLPTGVPTADVLAKLTGTTTNTNTNAGNPPKPTTDWTPAILALGIVVVIALIKD
jgi:hypothetical protein